MLVLVSEVSEVVLHAAATSAPAATESPSIMFATIVLALLVTMALTLVRAFAGPTLFDRVLALNSFGTKTVLLIAAAGFMSGRPEFLDIALVYALINFLGTVAVLKYFELPEAGATAYREDDY